MRTSVDPDAGKALLKEQIASRLRDAVLDGTLQPGQRVIEGTWARTFGVAQASVREAINLLIADGFLTKDSGRSARVTKYSREDIAQIYALRAVLEGLAAELATAGGADLSRLEQALRELQDAIDSGDMRALLHADLRFHLTLCELSGNRYVLEATRRLLVPLFSFVELQVAHSHQGPAPWRADLPRHTRLVEIMREGNSALAGQYARHCVSGFQESGYEVWNTVARSADVRGAKRRNRR